MNVRALLLAGHILLTAVLLGLVLAKGVELNANMLSALPESKLDKTIVSAEKKLFEFASKRVVVTFAGKQKEQAYRIFTRNAEMHGWKAQLPDSKQLDKMADLYTDYVGFLLTDGYLKQIADQDSYRDYFLQQLSYIANPTVAQSLDKDTSFASASYLQGLLRHQSGLSIQDDYFVAKIGEQAVIVSILNIAQAEQDTLGVSGSISVQEKVLSEIQNIKNAHSEVQIEVSGLVMHTAENAKNAQWEMSVFGTLSFLATAFVVIYVFRSFSSILCLLVTISYALVTGFVLVAYLFDSVHIITLVFGVTLIGLGADYCLHVLAHSRSSNTSLVGKTIIYAFVTTALSYSLLYFTPILILKQVAAFVCAGLFAAVLISLFLEKSPLLQFLGKAEKHEKVLNTKNAERIGAFLAYARTPVLAVVGVVCVYSVFFPISFDDDIASLNASSTSLLAAEQNHQAIFQQNGVVRVFTYASSLQSLLQKEELIATKLKATVPDVEISKLSDWVPSEHKQRANMTAFTDAMKRGVFDAVDSYIALTSIKPSRRDPLQLSLLQEHIGGDYLESRYVEVDGFHVSVLDLFGMTATDVETVVNGLDNTVIFDKRESINHVLSSFRTELMYWLVGAFAVISLMLLVRFDIRLSVFAGGLIVLTIYSALSISNAIQGTLNVFNLLSAILVIGLAVDFIIFYKDKEFSPPNIFAISLSAISSLFVFGMLAFSKTPAISSFGLTVTIGLLLIYILAPIVVIKRNEKRSI